MIIAHVDFDAFFASVEENLHPEYKGKPLVVGGNPFGRGVVATCNYHARKYGIHSAMPASQAYKLCPHAVFIAGHMQVYRKISSQIWEYMTGQIGSVEQVGIDEGYLDLSDMSFHEALACVENLQKKIKEKFHISVSIGVAGSKVCAKIASDQNKPYGITPVAQAGEKEFLAGLDIRLLPGVGPQTQKVLRAAGINLLGELAEVSDEALLEMLPGKTGRLLRARAQGIDPREVSMPQGAKSIGHEETFSIDFTDRYLLHEQIDLISEKIAKRLQDKSVTARTVTLKVRYDDFQTKTRSFTRAFEFEDAKMISYLATGLLDEALNERDAPVRLLGVSVRNLSEYLQLQISQK